jgi:hypothetical protein
MVELAFYKRHLHPSGIVTVMAHVLGESRGRKGGRMAAMTRNRLPSLLTVLLALVLAGAAITTWHPEPACAHPAMELGACGSDYFRYGEGDQIGLENSSYDPAAIPGAAGEGTKLHPSFGDVSFELLGHVDPGTGFNADVVAHGDVAYLGSWGRNSKGGKRERNNNCPSLGVRAYSLSDPSRPRLLATFADAAHDPAVAGSWTEKVIVRSVSTPSFRGDLAAVSFQSCTGATGFRGFGVYDVSDPSSPRKMALVRTGANGSHEIWLEPRHEKAYVFTAVINSEVLTSPDFTGDPATATVPGEPDFQVWDVSNPAAPVKAGGWGAWAELGIRPVFTNAAGVRRSSFVHSVTSFGNRTYVSYWDTGTVILDTTDPARPRFLGRTTFGPTQEGNAHSSWVADGGRILVETIEDFAPAPSSAGVEQAWGYTRVFDISNPATPRQLSTFELPTTRQNPPPGPGFFTVHDPKVRDGTTFFSYYAEGILAVDTSDAGDPRLVAQFRTPPTVDPRGNFGGGQPITNVWGVYLHHGLILASDINSGLYVLRLE